MGENFLQGGFTQVPGSGAEGLQLADPGGFTQGAADQLTNVSNFAQQGAGALAGGGVFDQFMSQFPQLQGLVQGATSDLERGLREQTSRFTEQATQDVASQFSGLGSLFSGATRDVAARRGQEAAAQAATQLGTQQLGLLGGLGSQAFGQLGSEFNQFMGLLGGTTGQQAAFGAPTFVQPQFTQDPSGLDRLLQLGSVASGFFPGGGVANAGLGALSSLFQPQQVSQPQTNFSNPTDPFGGPIRGRI